MDLPRYLKNKSLQKLTLDDCVFLVLFKAYQRGNWLMLHEIQEKIFNTYQKEFGTKYAELNRYYGTPTVSASVRNMRKDYCRERYELFKYAEVIFKRRRRPSKGYEYRIQLNDHKF